MKTVTKILKFSCKALLCGMLLLACDSEDPEADPGTPDPGSSGSNSSIDADTISNHLQFYNASQIAGTIPTGPAGSSLKISFEDTLHLIDDLKRPIKFLQNDPTKDVAGIYVQVHGTFVGSTNATYYYDVPESEETASSDSVSVIMIGFDIDNIVDSEGVPPAGSPLIFIITICPYDPNGLPIAGSDRIVKISKSNDQGSNGERPCGLVTQPGDYWQWQMSYIDDPEVAEEKYLFFNSPDKLWGLNGQDINGCCIDGNSSYDIICAGNTQAYRALRFYTFFNFPDEIYKFLDNGTYSSLTEFRSAIPDPPASDFCGNGPGVVHDNFSRGFHEGNWSIQELTSPVEGDSLYLIMQGTSSTGANATARPQGRIHYLDCELLVVIQPDNEGGVRNLVKFYDYRGGVSPRWYPFS